MSEKDKESKLQAVEAQASLVLLQGEKTYNEMKQIKLKRSRSCFFRRHLELGKFHTKHRLFPSGDARGRARACVPIRR